MSASLYLAVSWTRAEKIAFDTSSPRRPDLLRSGFLKFRSTSCGSDSKSWKGVSIKLLSPSRITRSPRTPCKNFRTYFGFWIMAILAKTLEHLINIVSYCGAHCESVGTFLRSWGWSPRHPFVIVARFTTALHSLAVFDWASRSPLAKNKQNLAARSQGQSIA